MSSNKSDVPVYDFLSIESKWRDRWEKEGVHQVDEDASSPSYYCLDMFPYPSGSGLHVGHWRGYVLSPEKQFSPPVWERHFTKQELCSFYALAYRKYYMRPRLLVREALSLRSWAEMKIKLSSFEKVFFSKREQAKG